MQLVYSNEGFLLVRTIPKHTDAFVPS